MSTAVADAVTPDRSTGTNGDKTEGEGDDHQILHGLALLGIDDSFPALSALQEMVSPDHYERVVSPEVSPQRDRSEEAAAAETEAAAESNAPAESAVVAAVPKEAEQVSPSPDRKSRGHASATRSSPARNLFDVGAGDPFKDASGVPIQNDELMLLFQTYDRDGSGFISRAEFKKEYRNFEDFGLEMTDRELDHLFRKFDRSAVRGGKGDDKLSFDEFALLMLHRSRL